MFAILIINNLCHIIYLEDIPDGIVLGIFPNSLVNILTPLALGYIFYYNNIINIIANKMYMIK